MREPALIACIALGVAGFLSPASMDAVATFVLGTLFDRAGGTLLGSVTFYLVLGLVLAVAPTGRIKLGRPDDQPEFSTLAWWAMLFSAGMGLGLVFFGVSEPLLHFAQPPHLVARSEAAARAAIAIAAVNWGVHAWGIFALSAVAHAYFTYRHGTSFLPSATLRELSRGSATKVIGAASDLLAIFAIVFGVAGSIAMAVMQFDSGMRYALGVQSTAWVPMLTLVLLVGVATAAAAGPIGRGIKWLSNLNIGLALAFLVVVFALGPTEEIVRRFFFLCVDYPSTALALSLRQPPFDGVSDWLKPWTLTYQIWFVAWAPFVAVFAARISHGRTVRELMWAMMFFPALACALWFVVFGTAGLHEEARQAGLVAGIQQDISRGTFLLLERLPLATPMSVVALVLLLIFTITSVDSGTFALAMITSDGALFPSVRRRVGWGIAVGALAAALLMTNRLAVLRAVAVSAAIPYFAVIALQGISLVIALLRDAHHPAKKSDDLP